MGANHPGDISELCAIANPDFGIITNVGKAHLEGFGSFEGVKRTKAELYAHLAKNDGLIFINSGNIHLKEMSATNSNRFTYGDSSSDLSGYIIGADPFLRLEIKFGEKIKSVKTNLTGKYNYENVLAAASVGVKFGIEPEKIIAALEKYTPKNNRSQWIEKESVKIIMDAYNANPTSMLSSLESFLSEDIENKALILGDMLELGEYSASEHLGILQYVASRKCRHVYCVGTEFSKIAGSFGFYSFNDVAQLTEYISQNTIDKKLILIKGSRGIRLEKVLDVFN
jgi:UDP-N-acetylmuramoyl-tripeptide--D-alanyl-D-alanine ligase